MNEADGKSCPSQRLTMLGGLRYRQDDNTARFPGSVGTVVAFLGIQDGPVKRTQLAGTVWPDVSEDRARGNLRSALWRLRKVAPNLVVCADQIVMIDEDVHCDFHETRQWADRLVNHQPTERDLCHELSPNALELLPGMYEDWAVFERERFRQRLLHATEELAKQLAQRGRYAEAIESALTAICADPLRESAHRVAVECHLAEHNVVEAHRQQRSYVRLLQASLGIDPSPDFMRLLSGALREPFVDFDQRFTGRVEDTDLSYRPATLSSEPHELRRPGHDRDDENIALV